MRTSDLVDEFGSNGASLVATLAAQADLPKLCRPREFDPREIFHPNEAYGHDLILKAYASLPRSYSLKIALPHGVEVESDVSAFGRELVPVVGCYTAERQAYYRTSGLRRVWTLATPFLYCKELIEIPDVTRSGTIFFPAHSHPLVPVRVDYDRLGQALEALPEMYKPITICMYWNDFNNGVHRLFGDRGFNFVSAGYGYDPLFLARTWHLCSMHQYSASNCNTSAVYYSIAAGCQYFYFSPDEPEWILPGGNVYEGFASQRNPRHAELLEDLERVSALSTTEQLAYANHYLGSEYLVSPKELRTVLAKAEHLDQWSFLGNSRVSIPMPSMPSRFRRMVRSIVRGTRR